MTSTPDSSLPERPAQARLRASDQDRDATAAILGQALATGRLTSVEHAERLDATYAARTVGELAPLTEDLPAAGTGTAGTGTGTAVSVPHAEVTVVRARFSKVTRTGRWVSGRHTTLSSHFGALIVSLGEAVLPGREITLELDAFCGKLIVSVPENARVIDEGGVLFGKRVIAGSDRRASRGDDEGPLIRLTGQARFSKVVVHRVSGGHLLTR